MQVTIRKEEGYELALYGLSLSFKDRIILFEDWWTPERFARMKDLAVINAPKAGGHNKFLESITVWCDIEMPRFWWQEFDTYRVGTSKQSESSMHCLIKRDLTPYDFDGETIDLDYLQKLNSMPRETKDDLIILKRMLPEGYLQRRLVNTNYQVFRNIIKQRYNHTLIHWQFFIDKILSQVLHPELLPNKKGEG